jgi:hypothetical protein
MKEFHCVLGNKGGVGKSLVASWLIQHATTVGYNVLGIECDQSNRTLSRYERLRTERLDLLDQEYQIDRRRFDSLMETLVADEEPFIVMDNGQASFAPLTRYMTECRAFDILREARRECFVHTVIAGGQLGSSTLAGFGDTLKELGGDAHIVVWHNEHFGPIDEEEYQKVVARAPRPVLGPVQLYLWSQPFEDDVQEMLKRFLTFDEAIASSELGLMNRQRLKIIRGHVFGALQHALATLNQEAVHAE